jgi:hypothetical protein
MATGNVQSLAGVMYITTRWPIADTQQPLAQRCPRAIQLVKMHALLAWPSQSSGFERGSCLSSCISDEPFSTQELPNILVHLVSSSYERRGRR